MLYTVAVRKEVLPVSNVNIVLLEPEIPQNTGNISRTCAATGATLHLIRPFGFEISDRTLKRAGLDYWKYLDVRYYDNIEEFFEKNDGEYWFFTTKAENKYSDVCYSGNVYLIFGKETKGLPEELLRSHRESCVRIPMLDEIRSLNLSNAAAIAVYEVLRQRGFEGFKTEGDLFK